MNQSLRIIGLLLAPSAMSIFIVFSLAILLSAGTLVQYGVNTNSLYDLILGSESAPELVNDLRQTFSLFYHNIFGNSTLNKVLFFLFWMLVGLVVYLFLSITGKGISVAQETTHEMHYVHANKSRLLEHVLLRSGVRLGVLVVIGLYTILFLKLLLPFSLFGIQIGAATMPAASAFGYAILGLTVLCISLFVYVIFLRLLFLRVRVWGAEEEAVY